MALFEPLGSCASCFRRRQLACALHTPSLPLPLYSLVPLSLLFFPRYLLVSPDSLAWPVSSRHAGSRAALELQRCFCFLGLRVRPISYLQKSFPKRRSIHLHAIMMLPSVAV